MLNYAYAVLEADARIKLVSAGYDPRIGILHVGRKRQKEDSFVFDLMEPMRPVVDSAVLNLVRRQTFSAGDFVLRNDGACRLSPALAAAVASEAQSIISGREFPADIGLFAGAFVPDTTSTRGAVRAGKTRSGSSPHIAVLFK